MSEPLTDDPIDTARDWLAEHYDSSHLADLLARLVAHADTLDVDNYRLKAENAALRKQIEGHCERIAAASEVIARNAQKSVWSRLEAWAEAKLSRVPTIWRPSCGWAVKLASEGERNFDIRAYGWVDSAPEVPDPTTIHCGDGASLERCVAAALDLWQSQGGRQAGEG